MLSVHRYCLTGLRTDAAQDRKTVSVNARNQLRTHQGPQFLKKEEHFSAGEEVIVIPLEDITRITYTSGIKKSGQLEATFHTTPTYEIGQNWCDQCCTKVCSCCYRLDGEGCCTVDAACCFCCAGFFGCCREENRIAPVAKDTTIVIFDQQRNQKRQTFDEELPIPRDNGGCCDCLRCWCCRKKRLTKLVRTTEVLTEQDVGRVITISIEYSKYSNPDSATNVRLQSWEDQAIYYKQICQPRTDLKFNLVDNTETDPKNFEVKRQQAEALCRIVMQLKGMQNNYPSEKELDSILDQPLKRTYGDVYIEAPMQLQFDVKTQQPLSTSRPKAIQ